MLFMSHSPFLEYEIINIKVIILYQKDKSFLYSSVPWTGIDVRDSSPIFL